MMYKIKLNENTELKTIIELLNIIQFSISGELYDRCSEELKSNMIEEKESDYILKVE